MNELFLKIVNMSISAGWLVLAVLLLRLLLKKAPKWISVLLWAIVAVRLICPLSFESVLSLIPSAETISPDIMMDAAPELHTGIEALNSVINPVVTEAFAPEPLASMNPLQLWIPLAAAVWLVGMFLMLVYTAVSYMLLRRRVSTAVRLSGNIYQSEAVTSPFVLGVIKPKIYLSFEVNSGDMEYVIAHENAHIRRKDHWWKPFGFLLLTVYWFNPFVWLGYVLLCRDIELACDEKVIREMDCARRADYTQALVSCSVKRHSIAACPLAFGEVGVKQRVKSVMNYKKPAFWIIIAAVVICAVVAVCFLTDPVKDGEGAVNYDAETPVVVNPWVQEYVPGTDGIVGNVDVEKYRSISADFEIGADRWGIAVFKDPHKAFLKLVALYPDAIAAIQQEFALEPLAENDYAFYKTYGWQVTSDSTRIREQATFVSGFFDIYENSFTESEQENVNKLKTYYALSDGTWRAEGRNYKYRLEITGRMHNAAKDSTFVYLSNIESITFERAWKAAGFSSNSADYFAPEEAILVEVSTNDGANGSVLNDRVAVYDVDKIDSAISAAILDHNAGERFLEVPSSLIHTESHQILGIQTMSATPVAGQTNYMEEAIVVVQYAYHRYTYSGGELERIAGNGSPAVITFSIAPGSRYTLKEFWEPNGGSGYAEEIRSKVTFDIAQMLLDSQNESIHTAELESQCLKKAEEYISDLKN